MTGRKNKHFPPILYIFEALLELNFPLFIYVLFRAAVHASLLHYREELGGAGVIAAGRSRTRL